MATKAETKAPATEAKKSGTPKGQPRPSAIVSTLDFSATLDEAAFDQASQRRSQWTELLEVVYKATEADEVPRNGAGELCFTKIGAYSTGQGAKAQIKAFRKRGLDSTYEFRTSGNDLYVRVIEVAEAEG